MGESRPIWVNRTIMSCQDAVANITQMLSWIADTKKYHQVSALEKENVKLFSLRLSSSNSIRMGCKAVMQEIHFHSITLNLTIFGDRIAYFHWLYIRFRTFYANMAVVDALLRNWHWVRNKLISLPSLNGEMFALAKKTDSPF